MAFWDLPSDVVGLIARQMPLGSDNAVLRLAARGARDAVDASLRSVRLAYVAGGDAAAAMSRSGMRGRPIGLVDAAAAAAAAAAGAEQDMARMLARASGLEELFVDARDHAQHSLVPLAALPSPSRLRCLGLSSGRVSDVALLGSFSCLVDLA
jgi:hypothetical protein